MTQRPGRWALLPALALVLGSTTSAQEKKEEFKETYEAFAVAMGTSNPPVLPPGVSTTLQINVTRWTKDEERERLLTLLIEKGQEEEDPGGRELRHRAREAHENSSDEVIPRVKPRSE